MPECKKCGNSFEVPENAIEMIFATHCKPCIKIAVQKYASTPIQEIINATAKQLIK